MTTRLSCSLVQADNAKKRGREGDSKCGQRIGTLRGTVSNWDLYSSNWAY